MNWLRENETDVAMALVVIKEKSSFLLFCVVSE
jgi:hypothetical protein